MIGIIGGAGPFAGLDLHAKILAETVANSDQDHLPILHLSWPAQILDRTEYLLGRVAENPAYAIARQLKLLANAGATVAAIPCNTAHAPLIYETVLAELSRTSCPIRFLHMIAETAVFLHATYPQIRKIGLLATTGTVQAGLYQTHLDQISVQTVVPPPTLQDEVHRAIYDPIFGVKAHGHATDEAAALLQKAVDFLKEAKVTAVILGCTELPLALTGAHSQEMLLIDPTRLLARALIRELAPAKLRAGKVPGR